MDLKNMQGDLVTKPINFNCSLLLAIIGAILISVSLAVFIGWFYINLSLTSISASWVSMKVNTTIGLFLSGIILILYSTRIDGPITRTIIALLSTIIIVINSLIIYQYVSGVRLGIDQLFINKGPLTAGTIYPGRPALITAINLLVVGLTLLYALKKHALGWIIQAGSWFITLVGMFAFYNYIYAVNMDKAIATYLYMAFHTSLLFMLLGVGILLIKPNTGIIAILLRNNKAGYFLRRMLPIGLLIPSLIALAENKISKLNFIGDNLGDSMYAVGICGFLSIFIVIIAYRMDRSESKLTAAHLQIEQDSQIFREFTENIDIVFFRTSVDFSKVLYISSAYETVWGKSIASLYENPTQWFDSIVPEDKKMVYETMFEGIVNKGQLSGSAEYRIKRPDDSIRNILARAFVLKDINSNPFCIIGIAVDVTEIKLKEKYIQLQYDIFSIIENEKSFLKVAPHTLEIICNTFDWNLGEIWLVDEENNILRCFTIWYKPNSKMAIYDSISRNYTFKFGEGLPGKIWAKQNPIYIPEYSTTAEFERSKDIANTGLKSALGMPIMFQDKVYGIIEFFSYKIHAQDEEFLKLMKNIGKMLGESLNITHSDNQLQLISRQDALTGLMNRSGFEENLSKLITEIKAETLLVIILDVDRFKTINEALGDQQGDLLLKLIAKRLSETVNQEQSNLARLGGDIYVLSYLPSVKINDTEEFLHTLKLNFLKPFSIDDHQVQLTVSLGIAVYPQDGNNSNTLIKNAGLANTYAKNEGRNKVKFYNKNLLNIAKEKFNLNIELHQAITKNQFYMDFQPQVDLKTGEICCAEALVRWQHPIKGLISPFEFISNAEQTGSIVALNEHVLRMVFHQIKADWLGPPVSVNISAQQFNDGFHLVEYLESLIEETEVDPKNIELEITEGLIMEDIQHNIEVLNRIHNLGFQFSIDDFGTGFSSFGYLYRIPAYKIKIDISFIRGLPDNKTNVAIVKSMISMFHLLEKKVVAEGVETESEHKFLRKYKCDIIQGYYYYKPMSAEDFFILIETKMNTKNKKNNRN